VSNSYKYFSLTFVNKAGALILRNKLLGHLCKVQLQALPENVRLGWKSKTATSNLA